MVVDQQDSERLRLFPLHPYELGCMEGFLSFSVNYRYRIVFQWENRKTAVLLTVGDHDVYK